MRTHSFAHFTYGKALHLENGEPSIERPKCLHTRAHNIAEAFNKYEIWKSKELVHKRPRKARLIGSPARCASIRCFRQTLQHAPPARVSRSSRVLALRGTRTRLVRHSLSHPVLVGCSARAARSRRFVPAMSSGFRPD